MLFFHDRDQAQGPVPTLLTESLARVFGATTTKAGDADRERAFRLLRETRARGEWIACDCSRAASGDMPLLSPRQQVDGRVSVVRHGRVEHIDACPFHRLRHEARAAAAEGKDAHIAQGPFLALAATPEAVALPAIAQLQVVDVNAWSQRGDRLTALLERVLQESHLNRLASPACVEGFVGRRRGVRCSDALQRYHQVDALGDAQVAGEIRLDEVSVNHLTGVAGLEARLARGAIPWPEGVRPQGFFAGVVTGVLDGPPRLVTETRDGRHLEVPVSRSLAVLGTDVGPLFALGVIAATGTPSRFGLVDVVAIPMLSRALLLPAAGIAERSLAAALARQLCYWRDRRGVNVTLRAEPVGSRFARIGARYSLMLANGHEVLVAIAARDRISATRKSLLDLAGTRDVVIVEAGNEDHDDTRRHLTAAVLHGAGKNAA